MENTIKDLEKAIELYNYKTSEEKAFTNNQIKIAKDFLLSIGLDITYSLDALKCATFCLNKDKLKTQLFRLNNKAFW